MSSVSIAENLHVHRLPNGMVLLGEPMPWLRTAACSILVPAGTCHEPEGKQGLAGATIEMVERGCGELGSREFLEALDEVGAETHTSVMTTHCDLSAVMPRDGLARALELLATAIRRPHLPAEQFEDVRQLCWQELRAMEDDPSNRCFSELKRFRFPSPYGRVAQGNRQSIEGLQYADVGDFYRAHFRPDQTVVSVAGDFDWPQVREQFEALFGDWQGEPRDELPEVQVVYGSRHFDYASSQTHLALAYDCPAYGAPDYYQGRALVGILSDGMSSRLFTEVRERRGLVYSVFATCFSIRRSGSVLCYAGTMAEHAEETLAVVLETIDSLAQGVTEDELHRLKVRVKASLVFEQESCLARCRQIANDWYVLGRVPPREEVWEQIEQLTAEGLHRHFLEHRPRRFTLVSVGSQPVELAHGID
ncbi:MAG: zinc protease [Pirellulaceae bacterium]|nr:MAG: zinc protease [Pirellulaceae bacterium]